MKAIAYRTILSILGAGVFYFTCLAGFLWTLRLNNAVIETIFWFLTPAVTAAGFATGVAIGERLTHSTRSSYWSILIWPLIGCAIGAGVVYWFGPMLIVFGMFLVGTLSVVLREARQLARTPT